MWPSTMRRGNEKDRWHFGVDKMMTFEEQFSWDTIRIPTCHAIHTFKVSNSVVFGVLMELSQRCHNQFLNINTNKKVLYPVAVTPLLTKWWLIKPRLQAVHLLERERWSWAFRGWGTQWLSSRWSRDRDAGPRPCLEWTSGALGFSLLAA